MPPGSAACPCKERFSGSAVRRIPCQYVRHKLSISEPGSSCLRTDLIGPLVQSPDDPTIVECSTAHSGTRRKNQPSAENADDRGMPAAFDPDVGELCLYAPWGNLCIFYRDFRNSASLIPQGRIDSGMDVIGNLTENFTVTMEAFK